MQEGLRGHGLREGDDISSRSSRAFALARRRVWESAHDNDQTGPHNHKQKDKEGFTIPSSSENAKLFTVLTDDIQETITFAKAQNSPSPAGLPSYTSKRFDGDDRHIPNGTSDISDKRRPNNGSTAAQVNNSHNQDLSHIHNDSHVSLMAARFNSPRNKEKREKDSNSYYTDIVGSPISRFSSRSAETDRNNNRDVKLESTSFIKPNMRQHRGSIVPSQNSDSLSTTKDTNLAQGGSTDYDISSIPLSRKRPFAERKSILDRYTKSVEARRSKPDISAFERTKRSLQNLEMAAPLEQPPSPRSVLKSIASISTPSHTRVNASSSPPSAVSSEMKSGWINNKERENTTSQADGGKCDAKQAANHNAISELEFSDHTALSKLPLSERLVREVQGLYLYQRSTREDLDRLEAKVEQLLVNNNQSGFNNNYNVSSTPTTFVRKSDLLFCLAWCILVIVCAIIFSAVILGRFPGKRPNTGVGGDYGYSGYYPGTS